MSKSIIAFDFGTKKIGVAIGQYVTGTAYPLRIIKTNNGVPNWDLVNNLLNKWQPHVIVIGLPLNMDGTEQPLTVKVREFASHIYNRFNIEVKLHDERLSTVEARTILLSHIFMRKLIRSNIDSISAMVILESYFNDI